MGGDKKANNQGNTNLLKTDIANLYESCINTVKLHYRRF